MSTFLCRLEILSLYNFELRVSDVIPLFAERPACRVPCSVSLTPYKACRRLFLFLVVSHEGSRIFELPGLIWSFAPDLVVGLY